MKASEFPKRINLSEPWEIQVVQVRANKAMCYMRGFFLADIYKVKPRKWKLFMPGQEDLVIEDKAIIGVYNKLVAYYDKKASPEASHSLEITTTAPLETGMFCLGILDNLLAAMTVEEHVHHKFTRKREHA
jgi:hypothetical protein